jgi:drug/metabolite transporter (DMT)-like permease
MLSIYQFNSKKRNFKKYIYLFLCIIGLAIVIFAVLKHIPYVDFAGSLLIIASALMYAYYITKEKYQ